MLTIFDSESPLGDEDMLEVRQFLRANALASGEGALSTPLWHCWWVALPWFHFLRGTLFTLTPSRSEDCWSYCQWPCLLCSSCAQGFSLARGKLSATWKRDKD